MQTLLEEANNEPIRDKNWLKYGEIIHVLYAKKGLSYGAIREWLDRRGVEWAKEIIYPYPNDIVTRTHEEWKAYNSI